jgi:cell division protein FtsB
MSLIRVLTWLLIFLIAVTTYGLFIGIDSKASFAQLQNENKLLIKENMELSELNNILESSIQSKQQNDLHAEKFAREELNLILKGEEFISFQETPSDAPK